MELADSGSLAALVDLITMQQQREFGQALSVAQALYDEQQIFSAALAKAASRRAARTAAYSDVKVGGDQLMTAVEDELVSRRDEFNARMASEGLKDEYHAHVFRPTKAAQRGWYFGQIVESARSLGYFADTKSYREWVRLSIANDADESATVLVIAVSSFGRTFKLRGSLRQWLSLRSSAVQKTRSNALDLCLPLRTRSRSDISTRLIM